MESPSPLKFNSARPVAAAEQVGTAGDFCFLRPFLALPLFEKASQVIASSFALKQRIEQFNLSPVEKILTLAEMWPH